MREIKFRAINKRTGEIEYIDDMYWFEENGVHGMNGKGHFDEYWMDEFTGLKDKNSVEIYEGDRTQSICELLTDFGRKRTGKFGKTVREVYWNIERCAWYSKVIESDTSVIGSVSSIIPSVFSKYNEVIGNIHENVGLLNED